MGDLLVIAMPSDITIISPAGKVVLPKEHFVPETDKTGKVLAWIYKPPEERISRYYSGKTDAAPVPQYERGDLP